MYSLSLKQCRQFTPMEMVAISRLRCGHEQLLVDYRMSALLILDGSSLATDAKIDYPDDLEMFQTHDWVVTPDGQDCYLFPSERLDCFLALDLQRGQARKIRYAEDFGETYLCWFLPTALFLERDGTGWIIKEDQLVRATNAELASRYPQWLQRVVNQGFAIEKAGRSGVVYVRGPQNESIGLVSPATGQLLMEQCGDALDVTHLDDKMFVCFQKEIVAYRNGQRHPILRAEKDCIFHSVNLIKGASGNLLSVLGWQGDDTVLWNYQLSA